MHDGKRVAGYVFRVVGFYPRNAQPETRNSLQLISPRICLNTGDKKINMNCNNFINDSSCGKESNIYITVV